jgi:mannosyltransferase OCH1-like enzyme
MKKSFLSLLLFLLVSSAFASDFEGLMGKGTESWCHLQTPEDKERLAFFKRHYDRALTSSKEKEGIPKVIHLIWLGPGDFPASSKSNVQRWMALHPDWTFKFWSDEQEAPPCLGMQRQDVGAFPFSKLEECYFQSENFGEKSEILRYEILAKEGGLFIDHDTLPLCSFDDLHSSFDFYCGLEMLGPSILSSSVFPSNHLMAAKKNHPLLLSAIKWLHHHWERLGNAYSGEEQLLYRVKRRTFSALDSAIAQGLGERDIVMPSFAFSAKEITRAEYATHAHSGLWHKKSNPFQEKINEKIREAQSHSQQLLFLTIALGILTLFFFALTLRKKKALLLLPFCLFFTTLSATDDFERLMGKETEHWKWVEQSVDKEALASFHKLYTKNYERQFTQDQPYKIPKVIHFIWLGPRSFPAESVENVRTWMAQNPDWRVKFWTDRKRPLPCNGMELCDVKDFSFLRLKKAFEQSQNWGEKSDVLRFEILFQEGGVYVDHDANCLKPFEGMHRGYDFYCGLEAPHPPFVGLNITCGNGVIGSRPRHPVVGRVIDLIDQRWEGLGRRFRSQDGYSRTQLVIQRTYIALTHALRDSLAKEGNVDIVLPAGYFFAKSGIPSLYSKHFFANSWAGGKSEESFKPLQKELSRLGQRIRRLRLALWGLVALNLALVAFTYFRQKSLRSQ